MASLVDSTTSRGQITGAICPMLLKLADGREYGFAVLDGGELVGAIGLTVVEEAKEAEVGYWLAAKALGRGIISRATRALIRFSFAELAMNRVVILCAHATSGAGACRSGSGSPSR